MANENPNPPNPFNQDPEKKDNNNQNPNIPNQNPYVSNMGAYNNPNVPPGGPGPQMPVPNSTAVLVLGIISLVVWFCYGLPGIICAVIALILSKKGFDSYNANPGMYTPASYSNLKAGRVCAIIGLIIGILIILAVIFALVFAISQAGSNRMYF